MPFTDLQADLVFELLFLCLLKSPVLLQLFHLLKYLCLLLKLLVHFHEYLGPQLDLCHRVALLSDVVTSVAPKQGTGVAALLPALDTDELTWLSVFKAHSYSFAGLSKALNRLL